MTRPGSLPPAGRVARAAFATAPLRFVALSMAGAVMVLAAVVALAIPPPPVAAPAAVRWLVGGLAVGLILVGVLLAVTQVPSADARGGAVRTVVSLALREAGGLAGVLLYVLGGGRAAALALAAAAAVSILALLPPRPAGR